MDIPNCFLQKLPCPQKNELCVSHIIDDLNSTEIHGNFIKFYSNENYTKQSLESLLRDYKLKGNCLQIQSIGKGSFKEVNLIDKHGKKYAVSMEEIDINNFKRTVQSIYREITTQQNVWSHYKDLTPKIYAANIFNHNEKTFLQLIMDNALSNNYKLIKNGNISSLNIINTELNTKNLKTVPEGYQLCTDLKKFNKKLLERRIKNHKYDEEKIKNMCTVFYNFDTVLQHWWEKNCTILSSIFVNLWKIHKLNILHQDLSEENVLCRKNDYNTYDIKFIDFGFSRSIDEWCSYYNEKYRNVKFTELYKEVYNYFNKNPFEKQNLNNPSKDFLKYTMLAELSDFHNIIENKYRNTYSFLTKSIFKDVTPIYLILFINIFHSHDYLENFEKNVLNKFKLFIADKYSEIVRSVYFKNN